MAFDETLADRIRARLDTADGVTEKRMFGGLAFLIDGNMAIAASSKGGLMVRVPPERHDELMAEPGAGPMEMRGKSMAGWLRVDGDAVESEDALAEWVDIGAAYLASLPPK
jgi:TfoX/Sxy family transcriptional regulator of competence genes